MVTIPCVPSGVSNWVQRTALGGRDYQLTFLWAQRSGSWTLLLADQDAVLITVLKLVPSWRLLQRCVDPRRPPGELMLIDTQGAGQDPGFSGLGDRWQLVYLDPSEL
jgi:hypothetical protein